MKDAKGHGSDSRNGPSVPSSRGRGGPPLFQTFRHPFTPVTDIDAAKALAQGGAKSVAVPVHSGAAGRGERGNAELMSTDERAQKLANWRDKGSSDAQVREGVRAMFNLPPKEKA